MKTNHDENGLTKVFHALADATRRDILTRLAGNALSISDLAKPYGMTLPAVCKHLRVLEDADLVRITKEGRTRHCSMNVGPLEMASRLIEFYRNFWNFQLDALEKQVAQLSKTAKKNERKPK